MADKIYAGRASVHGIPGGIAYSGVATIVATNMLSTMNEAQRVTLNDNFDVTSLKDRSGIVISKVATNRNQSISLEFVPTDVSGASPQTQAAALTALTLPDMLALITLSGFGTALFDGDWNYAGGGSVGLTNEGFPSMTLTAERNGADPAALTLHS